MTKTIVEMKFGSHLYGLATPQSDTDWKSVFVPTPTQLIWAGKGTNALKHSYVSSTGGSGKNTSADVDREEISIQKFIDDACSGQTYALDMLHCTEPTVTSELWETIVKNRQKFYTKNLKSYVGYARHQAAKYGLKGSRLHSLREAISSLLDIGQECRLMDVLDELHIDEYSKLVTINNPKAGTSETFYSVLGKHWQITSSVDYVLSRLRKQDECYGERARSAMQNEGVDFKALSHAIRAGEQVRCILAEGDFAYPLGNSQFIKDVKAGNIPFEEVHGYLEDLLDEVSELSAASNLPTEPDRLFFEKLVCDYYETEFGFKE